MPEQKIVPSPERRAEADALAAFLRAGPDLWPGLAPLVVERVGADRLRRIVAATEERTGGFQDVSDGPGGLVVSGPRGSVLAWAGTGADGALTDLLIAPEAVRRGRTLPPGLVRCVVLLVWCLFLAALILDCWSAPDLTGWAGAVLITLTGRLAQAGWSAPALYPWWIRRPIEAGFLAALCSAVRVPGLPVGGSLSPAVGAVLLAGCGYALLRARRHTWRLGTALPLERFPLDGRWYVVHGGGRGLNHHTPVPAQRGALDLLRVGPTGTRRGDRRSLDAHLAYGAEVYAPCAGRVAAAVDGLPDQVPGVVRYGPLYGNHVVVDTGTETVALVHLRPGSVAVTTGQEVFAGQLLGQVGNSGNSSEPHLHIHAERQGLGLDLRFGGVGGRLYRGRTVRG